jgi:Protein of unknown function (DUF2752)
MVAAASVLAALPPLYFVDPNSANVPLCPMHAISGLYCPLCGATRASYALLHGDLASALHDNALYVLTLPLLILLWWQWMQAPASESAGRPRPRPVVWAGIALVLAFGVLRNLPQGRWLVPPT